jgi:uncharacterized membrane protein YhaH (DUF805 family)
MIFSFFFKWGLCKMRERERERTKIDALSIFFFVVYANLFVRDFVMIYNYFCFSRFMMIRNMNNKYIHSNDFEEIYFCFLELPLFWNIINKKKKKKKKPFGITM